MKPEKPKHVKSSRKRDPKSREPPAAPHILYEADLDDTVSTIRNPEPGDQHQTIPSDLYLHLPDTTRSTIDLAVTSSSPRAHENNHVKTITSTVREYGETVSSRSEDEEEGRLVSSTRQLEIDSLPRPPLYPSYNTGTSIQADSDRSALHQVEFMTSESESETVRAQVERGSRLSGKEKAPDKRNTEHNKNCSRKHELNNKKPIEKTKQISSSSGTKPAVQLLPPNAFLVRHDGSPLVNPVVELGGVNMANVTIDTARTDASTRSLATSNLSSTIRRLDRQGVGHVTVDTVPGITTTSMISPADEVLYIKQQLIIFKDTKAKLKKGKGTAGSTDQLP